MRVLSILNTTMCNEDCNPVCYFGGNTILRQFPLGIILGIMTLHMYECMYMHIYVFICKCITMNSLIFYIISETVGEGLQQ